MSDDVKSPEWWTVEHTAEWIESVWGKQEEWSSAQRGWASKMQGASGAGASCYRPLTTKELAEMRAHDSRPANPCYYDGTPIRQYKPLTVKHSKKAVH